MLKIPSWLHRKGMPLIVQTQWLNKFLKECDYYLSFSWLGWLPCHRARGLIFKPVPENNSSSLCPSLSNSPRVDKLYLAQHRKAVSNTILKEPI